MSIISKNPFNIGLTTVLPGDDEIKTQDTLLLVCYHNTPTQTSVHSLLISGAALTQDLTDFRIEISVIWGSAKYLFESSCSFSSVIGIYSSLALLLLCF